MQGELNKDRRTKWTTIKYSFDFLLGWEGLVNKINNVPPFTNSSKTHGQLNCKKTNFIWQISAFTVSNNKEKQTAITITQVKS